MDVKLADLSDLSLPTVQRMEASDGVIRGDLDPLMKLMAALDAAGVALIAKNATWRRPWRAVESMTCL